MSRARVRTGAAALIVALFAGFLALGASAARAAEAPVDPAATPLPSTVTVGPAASPAPATGCSFGAVGCAPDAAVPGLPGTSDAPTLDPRDPSLLSGVAHDSADAATTVLKETFGWWLKTPSLPVQSKGVLAMQAMMLGLAGVVLTCLVIVQGIRMMMTRKGAPFAELVRGMVVASIVIVAGIGLIDSALIASDRMSDEIIKLSFADSDALVARMTDVMLGQGVTGQAPVLLLVFSLIVLTAGLLQAVLLLVRQCAIPTLGALLPLAAVGQAGPPATQRWLPRLLNMVVAIVLYKPVVALILSLGFVEFSEGTTLVDAIRGSVMLGLSVAAFFVLLKLFAPATYALAHRGGHGLAVLGPMGLATTFAVRGAGTPGDTTAVQHAAYMQGRGRGSVAVADGTSGAAVTASAPSAEVVAFPRGTGRTGTPPPVADTVTVAADVTDAARAGAALRAVDGVPSAARQAEPASERPRHVK